MWWLELSDQLGNQLFAYASLRAIARRRSLNLRLFRGTSANVNSIDRRGRFIGDAFELDVLEEEGGRVPRELPVWREPWPRTGTSYVRDLESLPDNVVIRGHFQCPAYFEWDESLRQCLKIRTEISSAAALKVKHWREVAAGRPIVAVHARIGADYKHEARTIGGGYYRRALQALERERPCSRKPFVVLFSDVGAAAGKYVRINADICANGSLFEDLAAMSLCDHHVIGNSSFAWWGAWLNELPARCVVRPSVFPVGGLRRFPEDVFPSRWLRVRARREIPSLRVFVSCVRVRMRENREAKVLRGQSQGSLWKGGGR